MCIDSSSVNDNAGRDFVAESNISVDDESSDNNLETNQGNNSENNDDFVNTTTGRGEGRRDEGERPPSALF